ncbi:MAG: HD domain-containing protein, partial [Patescibacteria group bacterium]
MKSDTLIIPKEVSHVTETLETAGFESFLVGGCVRDMLINRKPKDWDVTTNATPEQIVSLFPNTFYENDYGTVGVVNEEEGIDPTLKVVEITPYRIEGKYSNNRHPDEVKWSNNILDDLDRRDFTVNAIAIRSKDGKHAIVDPHNGQQDLKDKLIKTVGNPHERFQEDGLRILRAVRIATDLDFIIEPETEKAITGEGHLLKNISAERVRDEFSKIILSDRPAFGIQLCEKTQILQYFLPEIRDGIGCGQNQAHAFDVFTHLMKTLEHSAKKKYTFEVRLAALFHDIGKPATKKPSTKRDEPTFYGHDVVGARITEKILNRLKFPKKTIDMVVKLVRWHMFFSDTETITLSAVRRMIRNVGEENIWYLMDVRTCDRIGTGRPKESPYRLRVYHSMVEEAMRNPISVSTLKINGARVIEITKIPPGPKIGQILLILLEEALDNADINTVEYLEKRAMELAELDEKELKLFGEKAKAKKEELEGSEIEKIRSRHHVK